VNNLQKKTCIKYWAGWV